MSKQPEFNWEKEKILWDGEWEFYLKEDRKMLGIQDREYVIKMYDDKKNSLIITLPGNTYQVRTEHFSGVMKLSVLEYAHVVPEKTLEFVVDNNFSREHKAYFKVTKESEEKYAFDFHREIVNARQKVIKTEANLHVEYSKKEIISLLQHLTDVLHAYPFISFNFTKCFSIMQEEV